MGVRGIIHLTVIHVNNTCTYRRPRLYPLGVVILLAGIDF
jgi:hypothetical protein